MGLTSELLVKITADGKGVKYGVDDAKKYFEKFNNETLSKTTKTLSLLAPKLSESLSGLSEGLTSKLGKLAGFFVPGGMLLAGAGLFAASFEVAQRRIAEIVGLANRLDTTITSAERLRYAQKAVGLENEFEGPIGFLKVSRSKALSGDKTMLADFARIGISIADLKRMDPVALFEAIAHKMANGQINAVNFANAIATIGNEARGLAPKLKSAANAMDEFDKNGMASNPDDLRRQYDMQKDASKTWQRFLELKDRAALFEWGALYNVGRWLVGTGLGLIPTKKTQQMAEDIFLAGWLSRPDSLMGHVGTSGEENIKSMQRRLEERRALQDEALRRKREADNEYIDSVYNSMYGPGASSGGGASGAPGKVSGGGKPFDIPTMMSSDQLARVGLYSSTSVALNSQLEVERDMLAELRGLKSKLESLGIQFNQEE